MLAALGGLPPHRGPLSQYVTQLGGVLVRLAGTHAGQHQAHNLKTIEDNHRGLQGRSPGEYKPTNILLKYRTKGEFCQAPK